jgi:hypothetical protein
MFGKITLERIETGRPEPFVVGEPALRLLHRLGIEAARHRAADLLPRDQSRVREDIKVFEHRGE